MLYLVQSITFRELIKLLPFVSIISLPEVERWGTQRVNNTMQEIWKPIVGYEGYYEVSNTGKVKNCQKNKELKPSVTIWGYLTVSLSKNKQYKHSVIHRLVAKAFIPNLKNKPQVNHIDSDRKNNIVSNLEWVTAKENIIHASKKGRLKGRNSPKGEQCTFAKLNVEKVKEIRKLSKTKTNKELSKIFGVHVVNIGRILNNLSWKHVK